MFECNVEFFTTTAEIFQVHYLRQVGLCLVSVRGSKTEKVVDKF